MPRKGYLKTRIERAWEWHESPWQLGRRGVRDLHPFLSLSPRGGKGRRVINSCAAQCFSSVPVSPEGPVLSISRGQEGL